VNHQDQPIALSLCSVLPAAHSKDLHEIKSSLSDVDFSTCVFRSDHIDAASSYIIRSEENGSRTIVNYNDLPEMTLEEFVDAVYNVTKTDECWFHFEVRMLLFSLLSIKLLIQPHAHAGSKPGYNIPVHPISPQTSAVLRYKCRSREAWQIRAEGACLRRRHSLLLEKLGSGICLDKTLKLATYSSVSSIKATHLLCSV
jgi:hypothetical protein